jgi:hypothetical protein
MARETFNGAEEAMQKYRFCKNFQAKLSLFDETLERPLTAP